MERKDIKVPIVPIRIMGDVMNILTDSKDYLSDKYVSVPLAGYKYTYIEQREGRLSGIGLNIFESIAWEKSTNKAVLGYSGKASCQAVFNDWYEYLCRETYLIYDPTLRTDKGTFLKVGRLVAAMYPDKSPDEISRIAHRVSTELLALSKIDISCVSVRDDIAIVYTMPHGDGGGSLNNSCMRQMPPETFEIYHDMGARIAVIVEDNKLMARALLWDTCKLMDRIYSTSLRYEMVLCKYAEEIGYLRRSEQSLNCRKHIHPNGNSLENAEFKLVCNNIQEKYTKVPYIDTFRYYLGDGVFSNESRGRSLTELDRPDGYDSNYILTESAYTCCNCGCGMLDDYVADGEYYCEDCFSDLFGRCDSCGDTHSREELIHVESVSRDVCPACINEYYTTCTSCEEIFHRDHVTYVNDEPYCGGCHSDRFRVCDECGEVFPVDEITYIKSEGIHLCSDCQEAANEDN